MTKRGIICVVSTLLATSACNERGKLQIRAIQPNVASGVRTVSFRVSRAQLSLLDANMHRVVEPGVWRVLVGASSRDIRLRREVEVR